MKPSLCELHEKRGSYGAFGRVVLADNRIHAGKVLFVSRADQRAGVFAPFTIELQKIDRAIR